MDAIRELDRRCSTSYGSGDLVGLGQFILNLTHNPGDPDTDAENIAIVVRNALNEAIACARLSSAAATQNERK